MCDCISDKRMVRAYSASLHRRETFNCELQCEQRMAVKSEQIIVGWLASLASHSLNEVVLGGS